MKHRRKYRIYPTNEQITSLAKLFGCCRRVWNDAVFFCRSKYKEDGLKPSNNQIQKKFLTEAKKTTEREWLKEVSSVPLQQSLQDLDRAYKNFFDSCKGERKGQQVGLPKYKSKKSKQNARFTKNAFKLKQEKVYLAKVGDLKVRWSRPLPSEPSSVTVIKDCADRYFLSFVVDIIPHKLPEDPVLKDEVYGKSVGIDLGIIDFATLSNGEKIKSPKPLKKRLKKLKRYQRKLSKKKKGSNRREKARKRVAKLHAKVKDVRTDFLHKLSTKIVRENQFVILEDLNTKGMIKNRKLSRAISDLGWRSFRDLLEAKSEMYGRDFRIIDRWIPTSQTCSTCGFKGGKKELNIREWTCINCGATHDRDLNAAINIKVAGGLSETLNGRGGKVRPYKNKAHSKEASTIYKQLSLF